MPTAEQSRNLKTASWESFRHNTETASLPAISSCVNNIELYTESLYKVIKKMLDSLAR
ncbi:Hypothetical protein FKW44_013866 [Caligus rogercresseyi]|uniref:Uncharacterized protein n=1 Tax=Caligus rogercresseyi TaxID=217165 RepID=A0A7T8GYE5_CALRO|nr:Hypothetical protein FKW44_013866 [Caligus rogercresseyi]